MPLSNSWKRVADDREASKNSSIGLTPGNTSQEPPRLDQVEMFEIESPRRRLQDLIVADVTLQQIHAMLAKIHYHHTLYFEWNLRSVDPYGGRTAINLYGPPGTGKTFCAEAIAAELGKKIIRVNYAEIESKYVGETPKNIKAAFTKARETDVVLFFDEADSILGRRLTNVTQSSDHSVNVSRSVMLLELDRFEGITVFASNLPGNYDGAFVRRILGHIEMPLPDKECRRRLWNQLLPKEMPGTDHLDRSYLAEQTEGLSGGDILSAVILAASNAVQRDASQQLVKLEDAMSAITTIRKANREIGSQLGRPSRITYTDMPVEQAPVDIQKRVHQLHGDVAEHKPELTENP